MREQRSRRAFLRAAGLGALAGAAAGCVGTPTGGDSSDPGSSPDAEYGSGDSSGDRGDETTTPSGGPEIEHDPTAWSRYDPDWTAPTDSPVASGVGVDPEVLVAGLEVPWDLAWAPDGDLFLTERTGRLRRFDGEEIRTIASPPDIIDARAVDTDQEEMQWWVEGGEGGLLGVAVHPTYPDPARVYVYYTYDSGDERLNRVAYLDVAAEDPAATATPVVEGIPGDAYHNGGRLAFGPANYLWVTTGDGGEKDLARDGGSLAGKVLRVTPEGDPAPGNPDGDLDDRVFTYGHRNPQGITWLPDATPVATEHGPSGRDEVNVLEAGADHGWPDVRIADEYRGSDATRPVVNTGDDTWAPTGSVFYTGETIPAWRNRLIVGGLISQQIVVVTLTPPGGSLPPTDDGWRFDADWLDDRYTATAHPVLRDELGRVRKVAQGPDGALYALTSNRDGRAQGAFPRQRDDVLVRLVAA